MDFLMFWSPLPPLSLTKDFSSFMLLSEFSILLMCFKVLKCAWRFWLYFVSKLQAWHLYIPSSSAFTSNNSWLVSSTCFSVSFDDFFVCNSGRDEIIRRFTDWNVAAVALVSPKYTFSGLRTWPWWIEEKWTSRPWKVSNSIPQSHP